MSNNGRCYCMSNYRMKKLQHLEDPEQQVKNGVRQQLMEHPNVQSKRKVHIVLTLGLSVAAMLLVIFLIKPSDQPTVLQSNHDFSMSEIELSPLEIRESYMIASAIEWNGDKAATLQQIELVDGDGHILQYENDHLAMRTFTTTNNTPSGIYKRSEISDFDDWTNITFEPNSSKMILFNVIANNDFTKRPDLQLKLIFEVAGQKQVQMYKWKTLNSLQVVDVNFAQLIEELKLTDEELDTYNVLKNGADRTVLQILSPLQITRLYWLAEITGERRLQYKLYTTQSQMVMWTYEEQQAFLPFDTESLSTAIELFKTASQGEFVATSANSGYISFQSGGHELGFQLIRNDNGMWEVAFMPLQ